MKPFVNVSIYYQGYQDACDIICIVTSAQETKDDLVMYQQLALMRHVVIVIRTRHDKLSDVIQLMDEKITYVQKQMLAFRLQSRHVYLMGIQKGAHYVTMYYARYYHRQLKKETFSRLVTPTDICGIIVLNGQFVVHQVNAIEYIDEHFPMVQVLDCTCGHLDDFFKALNQYKVVYAKMVYGLRLFEKRHRLTKNTKMMLNVKINQFTKQPLKTND